VLIDILTIFPEMFDGPFSASIIGRAQAGGQVRIRVRNLRDFTHDRHRVVDDTPYGGGGGMVMKVEPLVEAIEALRADVEGMQGIAGQRDESGPRTDSGDEARVRPEEARVVYLTPQGRLYDQAAAERLARYRHLVLVCGHYEEVDERVRQLAIDEELSIGDYVLTGGELPAMVVVDSIVRLLPGVVGNPESIRNESFAAGLLDCPHYTRPEEFRGLRVPEVLLSGHHAQIEKWRRKEALRRTLNVRPELLDRRKLSVDDSRWLTELIVEKVKDRLSEKSQKWNLEVQLVQQEYKWEDDWLYLSVSPIPKKRLGEYSEMLSEIEKELRDEGIDNVLLVPTLPDSY
jgi:tRNA (guanine37-N1)-methyltransferase